MENGQQDQQNQDQTPKEVETTSIPPTMTIEANVAATVEGDKANTTLNFSSEASTIKISTSSYNEKLKEALKKWKVEAPELGHVRAVPVEDAHIDYILKALGLV